MHQTHKKSYLKKDFPLAACVGWINGALWRKKEKPSACVFEEGASRQKLMDLIIASPTTSPVLREMAEEYIAVREKYDEHILATMMDVALYVKMAQEKHCDIVLPEHKKSEQE